MIRFNRAFFWGLTIFVVFFSYYNWCSNTLRLGAGPDYQSRNDAVRSLYQNHRLAVFPGFDFGFIQGTFRTVSIATAQIDIDKRRQPDFLPF